MKVFPNAKINIGLNVVERRSDGYHNLETVFYPVGIHDVMDVEVIEGEVNGCELTVEGVEIAGDVGDNLICRAYRLLAEGRVLPAVRVHLVKRIPTGAGLGGGSSDAAYMLKAVNELAGLGLSDGELEVLAARLGADCAVFIKNRAVYATGIGNVFSGIDMVSLSGWTLVLVKPDVFVSTKDAYAMVRPVATEVKLTELLRDDVAVWKDRVVNDFERSVFAKFPEIEGVKEGLYEMGAVYACMSGSGASVFGLFRSGVVGLEERFNGMFVYSEVL